MPYFLLDMGPIQIYKCERLVEKDTVVFRESYYKTVRYDFHKIRYLGYAR